MLSSRYTEPPQTALSYSFGTVIVFALLLSLWPLSPLRAAVFDAESFALDNGLQVVVVENHRAPIVSHMIWYKVGAADEAPGESGLAHFLEHLMFKGTEKLAPGEFSQIVAANGGRENAFTSWDFTAYFQSVAKDRLAIMMEHEADRMTNLVLTDEVVLPEREVVREERRSRIDNEPSAQLDEVMRATQFLNHPYRIPIIGWDHEIEALGTESALAFYRKWYAPNNAILIVAGDISVGEVRMLAEKYYGPIPRAEVPERIRTLEPVQRAARRVILESPRVTDPSLRISYLAPSYRTSMDSEAYALEILAEVLGGGATSRLYASLVVKKGLAAAVGCSYGGTDYDSSTFEFYGVPRPGIELDTMEQALRGEIERVLEEGLTGPEIEQAKRRLSASAIYARDRLDTAPNVIGRALTTGRDLEEVQNWPELIEAVTLEQVNAVAQRIFFDQRSVTGLLLPEPTT